MTVHYSLTPSTSDGESWRRLTAARAALELVDTPIDGVKAANGAALGKEWARRIGASREAQREWSVFAIEAARFAGKLLRDMPKAPAGRPGIVPRKGTISDPAPPTIHEVIGGKTRGASLREYQRMVALADVPDDVVESYLTDKTEEPTTGRLLRIGRDAVARRQREVIDAEPDLDALPATVDLRVGDFRQALADLADVDAIITDPAGAAG